MANTLKKTVVVGLGGTGMHAVLHMKRKLLKTYGEIPPMFKFLVIDTTDRDRLEDEDGIVELEPGEFLKLQVREANTLIATQKEVREWMPEKRPKFASTGAGAGQVRCIGRLAVFANANAVEHRLSGLIGSIRDWSHSHAENYDVISENVLVNLVCSLSGGTGAGCFFDVAVLLRDKMQEGDRLLGYLLLPDSFLGKPATINVQPNAYGALKEIDHFSFGEGKYRYQLGGRSRSAEAPIFNAMYLVNKTNTQGLEYNDISDLYEFLGNGMCLQSTATGKGARDVIDNLENQIMQHKWFGKPTVYSSFGISEVVYPGGWYADLYTRKIALQVLQTVFLGGDVEDVESKADDFLRIAQLREHDADDVIDRLLTPQDRPPFPIPAEPKKLDLAAIFARRQAYLADRRRESRDNALRTLSTVKAEKTQLIDAKLREILGLPKGLELARAFVSTLQGRWMQYREEMTTEREACERQREDMANRLAPLEAEAAKEANSLWQPSKRTEAVLKRYKVTVEHEAELIAEVERRDRAIDLFAFLTAESEKWSALLGGVAAYSATLVAELTKEVQQKQSARRELKPFSFELKPAKLTSYSPKVEALDFLTWLRDTKGTSLLELGEKRLADFKDLLLDYGAADPVVTEIRSLGIEDVLKQLSAQERMAHVKRLDAMAAPLWQYDQGYIANDKHTEHIYLFGVPDRNESVVEPDTIGTAIASPYPPAVVSTGDRSRIVCLKIESAVPAFAIANVERYREKYREPNRPFSYHLHKDWDTELPDLFPQSDEDQTRRYWALALAEPFNLVTRKGEYYYVRSERKGQRLKEYLVRLGQGRREAMRAFLDDGELVEEVREAIDSIVVRLGFVQVTEGLRKYCQDLETRAGRQTEEVRLQIEEELKDIDAFAASMASL